MNKIKIFEQNHEFQEIINYYEEKCDEYNKKNELKNFQTQITMYYLLNY